MDFKLKDRIIIPVQLDADGYARVTGHIHKKNGDRVLLGLVTKGQDDKVTGMVWSEAGFWYSYIEPSDENGEFSKEIYYGSAKGEERDLFILHWHGSGSAQVSVDGEHFFASSSEPSVFILGSCVSRDCFERPDAPVVGEYIARSSIVSSMSELPSGLENADLSANASAFQRRMVEFDLQRKTPSAIRSSTADLLVVDFIDERFSLGELPNRGPFTYSNELVAAKLDRSTWTMKSTMTEDYYQKFAENWKRLVEVSEGKKILVNRVFWSHFDDLGEPLPQPNIAENNAKLLRLYRIIEDIDSPQVSFTTTVENNPSDSAHRWGRSPFHFTSDFERQLVRELWANLSPDLKRISRNPLELNPKGLASS